MINRFLVYVSFSLTIFNYSFCQQSVKDDEGIYLMCEKMPELIGGMDGLQKKLDTPCKLRPWVSKGGICTGNY